VRGLRWLRVLQCLVRSATAIRLIQQQPAASLTCFVAAFVHSAGEGCALHPSYASFALNRTGSGVVAQYVASSLTCASLVDRGEIWRSSASSRGSQHGRAILVG